MSLPDPSDQPDPLTPQTVAAELRHSGIIDAALTECVTLSGGTNSRVGAVSRPGATPELVIKLLPPALIQSEAAVLRTYAASPLLPTLRYEDPAHRFIVCDFRPGTRLRYGQDHVDVAGAMLTLVRELLALYVPAEDQRGAHYPANLLDEDPAVPMPWTDFLGGHVAYRHRRLGNHLPPEDLQLVERLARALHRVEHAPLRLLHGDCGAHNFLFQPVPLSYPGHLSAVIDPYPIVGFPIHDLVFAFVSWPNALDPEAILPAALVLQDAGLWRPNGDPERILAEEVLIAFYMRLGTCLSHHPEDLPAYLAVWPRWRALGS